MTRPNLAPDAALLRVVADNLHRKLSELRGPDEPRMHEILNQIQRAVIGLEAIEAGNYHNRKEQGATQ